MENPSSVMIAIAWCLAWGDERSSPNLIMLEQTRQALKDGKEVPEEFQKLVKQVQELQNLPFPNTVEELKQLTEKYPHLWDSQIGLVYGGATKIKQYVFEAAKLPDIRGASALLDRINLIDLPAFFGEYGNVPKSISISQWLKKHFPDLEAALIPELIIYSTGGNILAFCPGYFADDLANAIEKRYTEETLTANSCAVGAKFKALEIRFGLLHNQIDQTFWLEKYNSNLKHELIEAYFYQSDVNDSKQAFKERKSFNELAGKLASLFNQRRNGNDFDNCPSRRYPPMFETHPYLKRDEGDRRSSVMKAEGLPNEPWFSETLARKRIVGQISKRDDSSQDWYYQAGFDWKPNQIYIPSWVKKFEDFLVENELDNQYYNGVKYPEEARSLIEIGNASTPNCFVAYIYADGNNMGGYIQKIKTPQKYQQFSNDIFKATEQSVYKALAQHLHPHQLKNIKDQDKVQRNGRWIHPFEILTIGGDDVMLIVPADKALAIAKTIGEEFERRLADLKDYQIPQRCLYHRYHPQSALSSQCKLSMSTGVLITAEDTPIYYAEKLTNQLLKSAKKGAKELKKYGYYGGTVDFLVMKSVTMISSNISEFRSNGLTKYGSKQQKLKLYAAPYTLHELGGLLETAKALKDAEFPRSQLYQIRSLLERGKQTAILNYRYFRVRLSDKKAQDLLKTQFEEAWCKPKQNNNNGNLAPWMSLKEGKEETKEKVTYETIWRDLVDLYPFIAKAQNNSSLTKSKQQTLQS
ncbi:type III-B CRISPR-associated protein Cas10/Cmr2 [Nostoc sp. 'Peltigera membranacea cyanobiont' 232]|uniref:type III-B CRISPR-associated protein Cas10/Cmr2 n=1 Tax=Nostoc sp. 'Peltigera membranacea cyanobiont' 232 TaxID=2014531 RepID=UPI000B955D8B|nr:type III-B CRISPR-associated protein Cas10/Cmr2 [Nostoc sp. 'Peltigera membranacea cyanobiont' 232]OYE00524.1 type III-B CRISPR-associated protein Cas10/Cmr2 [Nostoc sp. 'Peltigera membranacea cyanobiont' 232]